MRVCNRCRKPLSVANIRRISIVDDDKRTIKSEGFLLEQQELCPECISKISDLIMDFINEPTAPVLIAFDEFKERVINVINHKAEKPITRLSLSVVTSQNVHAIEYKPNRPKETTNDFSISYAIRTGEIVVYGNKSSLFPGYHTYENITKFEESAR